MDSTNAEPEMGQFFDFSEAAMPDVSHEPTANAPVVEQTRKGCPAHGDVSADGCLCHGFYGDFAVPDDIQVDEIKDGWNNDFSTWLPRYHKPEKSCDYCRSRSLECFIYDGDKMSGCSPCNALFRPCSFAQQTNTTLKAMSQLQSRTALDTLDSVAEDSARLFGGLTGKKPMRCLGHTGPIETDDTDGTPKKGAAAARFPRAAVKVLKDWMIQHLDHPYPTDEEKEQLKEQTGLTTGQISNWMANTRRRQKARPKRSASPSIRPSTEPLDIPAGRTWESLNPFERWKHSPPENEPAPMTAIADAVERFEPPEPNSLSSSFNERKGASNDSTGSFSVFRAPSTTSLETGFTNMSSGSAQSSGVWSQGSRNSLGSLSSLNSRQKERRRRRRLPTRAPKQLDNDLSPRLFQCTFCTDRFKSKYDWSRHEKTLHLSLEKWICAPLGEVLTCTSSGERKCAYCDEIEPTREHLETHNHRACEEKGLEARTFYRKDHLRQHLRLMHGCKMTPTMETWKAEASFINSRCGFCGLNFDKWQDRVDHLAKEFRNGALMKNWKGCRGLDAHVAAHVQNAMPPYLIANESKSPFPFSATNGASIKHHSMQIAPTDLEYLIPSGITSPTTGDISIMNFNPSSTSPSTVPLNTPQNTSASETSPHTNPNATCWEILTLRLGRFAREQTEQHGVASVTDEVLQQKARLILYDSDDPWNQTAADNPEWLSLFKKAHGIDDKIPYPDVISRHDLLEDLGLNANALVDESFNYRNFACGAAQGANGSVEDLQTIADLALECSLAGSLNLTKQTNRLSMQSNLTVPELSSTSTSVSNVPVSSFANTQNLNAPISDFTFSDLSSQLNLPTSAGMSPRKQAQNVFMNASMPTPIQEIACTMAGEPVQDHFAYTSWDQLPEGFQLPNTTAPLSASIPTTLPVTTGFEAISTSTSGFTQGNMAWDDADLTFSLDMDMDLDASMDNIMGAGNTRY